MSVEPHIDLYRVRQCSEKLVVVYYGLNYHFYAFFSENRQIGDSRSFTEQIIGLLVSI